MTDEIYGNYIVGQWQGPGEAGTFPVYDPATGAVVAEVATATAHDVKHAINGAAAVQPTWGATPPVERQVIIRRACAIMTERIDELGRLLVREQGKPLAQAKAEILHSADTFEWFGEEGKRAYGQVIPNSQPGKRHRPSSTLSASSAAISPWNFPITLQSRKIAPALAAGCTVVSKPASQTPLILIMISECMVDAGLPAGVANLVMRPAQEIADEFLENPLVRKISFTGSTEVGKHSDERAADQVKRLSLELGGHAPLIVFPDADPEQVAKRRSSASSATTARCASPPTGSTSTKALPRSSASGVEHAMRR